MPRQQLRHGGRVTIHRLPLLHHRTLPNAVGPGRQQVSACLTALAPDAVHAHDSYGVMVKGLPIPRVFTVHGFIHADTALEGGRRARLRAWLWKKVEAAAWADQPHIISITPYVRRRLAGIARGVIHDIDNPVAEPFFQVERDERPGTIFCAAHLSPLKNTVGLIEAFARLVAGGVDAELRLAGSAIDDDYDSLVHRHIEQHGLAGRVSLLGQIGTEQVRQELAAASVFALVSLHENAPMGIAEAMAAGVPVVTSNRCGMPYMVREGESGYLVEPDDPDQIADRLRRLLAGDDLRRSMGTCGREIAQQRFHPAAVAARTREVYYQAAQDSTGSEGHA